MVPATNTHKVNKINEKKVTYTPKLGQLSLAYKDVHLPTRSKNSMSQ